MTVTITRKQVVAEATARQPAKQKSTYKPKEIHVPEHMTPRQKYDAIRRMAVGDLMLEYMTMTLEEATSRIAADGVQSFARERHQDAGSTLMPVQIVRKAREPYRHRGITEGKLFGYLVTDRKTGRVEKEVGLFKNERDFEEAMDVWNAPPVMQWVFRRDPEWKAEDAFVQPVL